MSRAFVFGYFGLALFIPLALFLQSTSAGLLFRSTV